MPKDIDFDLGFELATKKKEEAAVRGMGKAGMLLMTDAATQVPKVPHNEGTLRGSGSVHVNHVLVATSTPEGAANPSLTDDEPLMPDTIVATVGFNQPYAEHLHEHPEFKFGEQGTGGKYLESKMQTNADGYLKEVADEIKAEDG